MSDQTGELDLKFMPDWLKESPAPNRYANFEGDTGGDRFDRRGGGGKFGGPRPGGPRPGGPGGPRRDDRGPRPGGGARDNRGGGGKPGSGPRRPGGPQNDRDRDRAPRPPQEPVREVVRVQVMAEPAIAMSIAKQVKVSSRACGVFRLAQMFLERPERLRIRVTAIEKDAVMYQIGDGIMAFDRSVLEKGAYQQFRNDFYITEVVQGEPPKGNYTSVARDRLSGALLGPSSHHGYQVALRKLYEERYSRRMDFNDFLRNIEMVNDPVVFEQWKLQASSVTVIKTKVAEGDEQLTFKDEYEAEQHFKLNHLPNLVKSGTTLEMNGSATNWFPERNLAFNVRDAIDREHRFPGGIVNALRPIFSEAGLHHFKWKKKILFVSAIRPQRHTAGQQFSDGMAFILTTVAEHPGIPRPDLALRLLAGIEPESEEYTTKKEALVRDLHYLIHVGHVVEFQNGALELPLDRRAENKEQQDDSRVDANAEMADLGAGGQQPKQQQQRQNQPKQNQPRQPQQPRQPRPRRDPGYLLPIVSVLL